jgi:aminopeptidase C
MYHGTVTVSVKLTYLLCQSLKAGHAVFFGCDVGQFSESSSGIMDIELFEYEVGVRPLCPRRLAVMVYR